MFVLSSRPFANVKKLKSILQIYAATAGRQLASEEAIGRLERCRHRLNRVQEAFGLGGWEYSFATRELWLSEGALRTYRTKAGSSQSPESLRSNVHASDRARIEEAWAAAEQRGTYDETFRLSFDEETVWIRETAKFERDDRGKPLSVLVVVREATKTTQMQLKEPMSLSGQVDLFGEAGIGIAKLGLASEFLQVSAAFAAITGYSINELLKLSIRDINHPDDLTESASKMARIIEGGSNTYKMKKRYVTAEGSDVWVEECVMIVRGSHLEPKHFIMSAARLCASPSLATS